jgi:hypothetical protein
MTPGRRMYTAILVCAYDAYVLSMLLLVKRPSYYVRIRRMLILGGMLGVASNNVGDNMDEGVSRQRHGGTLVWEPPLTISRLKCLGHYMKRRVFIGCT